MTTFIKTKFNKSDDQTNIEFEFNIPIEKTTYETIAKRFVDAESTLRGVKNLCLVKMQKTTC